MCYCPIISTLFRKSLQKCCEADIIPILLLRKIRVRLVKVIAQGHIGAHKVRDHMQIFLVSRTPEFFCYVKIQCFHVTDSLFCPRNLNNKQQQWSFLEIESLRISSKTCDCQAQV